MIIGTRAIEVDCPRCHTPAGAGCPCAGDCRVDLCKGLKYCIERVRAAADITRDANRKARRS